MSRSQTTFVKGFAILLMMYHHLFGCGMSLVPNQEVWFGLPWDETLASSSKICIALYLICSGYGLYKSAVENNRGGIKRVFDFACTYWTIMFLVAVPYLVWRGNADFSIGNIFMNLFALKHDNDLLYVSFSWYVKLHFLLLLIIPILRAIDRKKLNLIWYMLFLISGIAVAILLMVAVKYIKSDILFSLVDLIKECFQVLFLHLPLFYIGYFGAKFNVFKIVCEKLEMLFPKSKVIKCLLYLVSIIAILLIRTYFNVYDGKITDIIYGPIVVIFILGIERNIGDNSLIHRIFMFLGKYSFQYWLLSGMFFLNTVELQRIPFLPKFSVIVLVWTFVILTPGAVICDKIAKKIIGIPQKF